jgi:hypothetical protein
MARVAVGAGVGATGVGVFASSSGSITTLDRLHPSAETNSTSATARRARRRERVLGLA